MGKGSNRRELFIYYAVPGSLIGLIVVLPLLFPDHAGVIIFGCAAVLLVNGVAWTTPRSRFWPGRSAAHTRSKLANVQTGWDREPPPPPSTVAPPRPPPDYR
jgi:hypothetical protein